MITNGNILYKKTCWFLNFRFKFDKKVYYCKLLARECFETHVEYLFDNCWCLWCFPSMNSFFCMSYFVFVINNYDVQGNNFSAMMPPIPVSLYKVTI